MQSEPTAKGKRGCRGVWSAGAGIAKPMALGKNGEVILSVHESCALTSPEQLGAVTSLQIDLELNGLVPARVGQAFQRQLSLVAHSLFLLYVKGQGSCENIFSKPQAMNIYYLVDFF